MSANSGALEYLVQSAPWSWAMLLALFVGYGAGLLGAILGYHRSHRSVWTLVALGALVLTIALLVAGVMAGRSEMLATTAQRDPALQATRLAEGVTLQMNLPALIGFCAPLYVLIALGFVLPIVARRDRSQGAAASLLAVAIGAPLGVAALGTLGYVLEVIHSLAAIAGIDPAQKSTLLETSLRAALEHITRAHVELIAVTAIAIAGAVGAAVLATRSGHRASRAHLVTAGALLLSGLAAVGATRGHAADRLPLPALGDTLVPSTAERPPGFTRCRGTSSAGPVLTLDGDRATLNGEPIALRDTHDVLLTLRNNFRLLHPTEDFPGQLLVLAGATTPMARLAPYLLTAEIAGYPHQRLIAIEPRPYHSRTLGVIDRVEQCALDFEVVESEGTPWSTWRTWGELAAALEVAPHHVSFALDH